MIKLSIVIPVYNVEHYIVHCLTSCINQSVPSDTYEIIIVNDGTKDNSIEVIKDLINKHPNITLINQQNQGLSIARNQGLILAKGEFVWFIDSDDWIEENCLEEIYRCLDEVNPDFLQLQYRIVYDKESYNRDCYCKINGIITGVQQINNGGVPIPAQFVIYRRTFLLNNNLYFYPRIFHEDCEFKPRVLFLAKRCASYNKVVYNYYQRSIGSITSLPNPKRAYDCIKVAHSIDVFYSTVTKGLCDTFFHNHIALIINNALSIIGDNENELSIELFKHKHLFMHLRKSSIIKYKIEGYMFTLFPKHPVVIYRILCKFKSKQLI